jgi:hypothetical protein
MTGTIKAFVGSSPELPSKGAANSGTKSMRTPAPIRGEREANLAYGNNHYQGASSTDFPGQTIMSGFLDTDPVMKSVQTLGTGGRGDRNADTQERKIDSSTPGVPIHSAMKNPDRAGETVPGSLQGNISASPSLDAYSRK